MTDPKRQFVIDLIGIVSGLEKLDPVADQAVIDATNMYLESTAAHIFKMPLPDMLRMLREVHLDA